MERPDVLGQLLDAADRIDRREMAVRRLCCAAEVPDPEWPWSKGCLPVFETLESCRAKYGASSLDEPRRRDSGAVVVATLLPVFWPMHCVHSPQSDTLLCFIGPQEAFVRWVMRVALGLAVAVGAGIGFSQALRHRAR